MGIKVIQNKRKEKACKHEWDYADAITDKITLVCQKCGEIK